MQLFFGYTENAIPFDIETALRARAQHSLHVLSKEAKTDLIFKWEDKEATLKLLKKNSQYGPNHYCLDYAAH